VQTVGIVSPGAMGSAMAGALTRGGARVVATLDGRSERTARLVERTGLELLPDLGAVVEASAVVLSIAPPEAALEIAGDIASAARGRDVRPLVADLNAIAPTTARELEQIVQAAECPFVDGSISGPPPSKRGTTRLYLSGARAPAIAALPFDGVECIVVGDRIGDASAVKMSTASVYKGTTAVLTQALLAARANGVLEHVLADLERGAPELVSNSGRRVANGAAKASRYVGEMREIAEAQSRAGLTPALFEAMAEVYATLSQTSLAQRHPEELGGGLALRDVLDELAVQSGRRGEPLP
jgi:3-hydroxyisobutyrate dehydrogenase-like beta-hydroxyacid dehydrogenase